MAVKNYVLDTNVLLHDARAFFAFADNNVVIPIYVIEEIDTFKKDQSELGRNARQVARLLDQYRSEGGLSQPQKMETGGTVRVALSKNPPKNPSYDSRSMDQRILEIALEVRDADPKHADDPRHQGRQHARPRRRARPRTRSTSSPSGSRSTSSTRATASCSCRRARSTSSTPTAPSSIDAPGPARQRVPDAQGRERQDAR